MSLLDDVSIVVTPNGYKAGELYAVIPVPTEGAEEVDCGDFSCAVPTDYWSEGTGWDTSGGSASSDGTASFSSLSQASVLTIGKFYKLVVDINLTSGQLRIQQGGTILETYTTTGTNTATYYFTATATNIAFKTSVTPFLGSIDNVSVKEYTSADMDVTRATAATRVDENGLVNYAEVIGGEEVTCGNFECAVPTDYWSVTGVVTIASGVATFLDNGTNANSGIAQSVLTTNKTYKIVFDITRYVAGRIEITAGGGTYLVDISGGVGAYTTIIESVGSTTFRIKRNGGYSGFDFDIDNVSVKEVTRDNVPRIDYTGGGCPHILAEPMRTNLIPYSETFSDSSWDKINSTLSSDTTSSPSGDTNASTIVSTSATNQQYIDIGSLSVTSGDSYTLSCFVKKKDYDYFLIRYTGAGGAFAAGNVFFNINSGALGTIDSGYSGTITDFGNGWYKCTATTTASGTTGSAKIRLQLASADNNDTIAGDGSSGTFVWGSQMEEGSYATSYIPNFGTALGVTRNQDIFTRDGIGSLINSTEGTFFIELSKPIDTVDAYQLISLNNNAANSDRNSINIGFANMTNKLFIRVKSSGSNVFQSSNQVSNADTFYKVAVSYKSGESKIFVNGSSITPESGNISGTFTFDATLDKLSFDYNGNNGLPFYGNVRQLQVYDTALTDEQLLQLTGESGTDFYESYAEMASALTYTIQ